MIGVGRKAARQRGWLCLVRQLAGKWRRAAGGFARVRLDRLGAPIQRDLGFIDGRATKHSLRREAGAACDSRRKE